LFVIAVNAFCIVLFMLVTCLNVVLSIMARTVDIGVYYHS